MDQDKLIIKQLEVKIPAPFSPNFLPPTPAARAPTTKINKIQIYTLDLCFS